MLRFPPLITDRALNKSLPLSPAKAETILAVPRAVSPSVSQGTDESGAEANASAPPKE
ncbi:MULTISPECIES: hypothetical protein [unclassified Phyllobacterium]|uniref:hypothetical protein n=1 Tax=unclassified Phyllobacterium TaxID=2638441 RepID=UPI003012E70D